ncbi:MAG: transcription antitermination factor NusB [Alphaproteobacteria bacterium]|nr:transcription antitermination factor NusB [Alphaproteobacteria bacterium]
MTAQSHSRGRARLGPGERHARALARLAAVQALYQMEIAEADAASVIAQFAAHGFAGLAEGLDAPPALAEPEAVPDTEHFESLVSGVVARQGEVDRAVNRHLSAGWKLERVDAMLRALLRAAAFELIARPDIPARATVASYVDLAHAFYGSEETGFVNGLLDALAHEVRTAEFGAS